MEELKLYLGEPEQKCFSWNPFKSKKIDEAKKAWDEADGSKEDDDNYKSSTSFWKAGEDPDDAKYKYGPDKNILYKADEAGSKIAPKQYKEISYDNDVKNIGDASVDKTWIKDQIDEYAKQTGASPKSIYTNIIADPLFEQLEKSRKTGAIAGGVAGAGVSLPLALKLANKICQKYNIQGKKATVLKTIIGLVGTGAGAYGGAQLGGLAGEKIGQKIWEKRFSVVERVNGRIVINKDDYKKLAIGKDTHELLNLDTETQNLINPNVATGALVGGAAGQIGGTVLGWKLSKKICKKLGIDEKSPVFSSVLKFVISMGAGKLGHLAGNMAGAGLNSLVNKLAAEYKKEQGI